MEGEEQWCKEKRGAEGRRAASGRSWDWMTYAVYPTPSGSKWECDVNEPEAEDRNVYFSCCLVWNELKISNSRYIRDLWGIKVPSRSIRQDKKLLYLHACKCQRPDWDKWGWLLGSWLHMLVARWFISAAGWSILVLWLGRSGIRLGLPCFLCPCSSY